MLYSIKIVLLFQFTLGYKLKVTLPVSMSTLLNQPIIYYDPKHECEDISNNNIIKFGNYILYRPCKSENIKYKGVYYNNAILIDVSKPNFNLHNTVDQIVKKYKLNRHTNLNDEQIKDKISYGSLESNKFGYLNNVNNYLEIPDTDKYYLERIQVIKNDSVDSNILIITHKYYTKPRTYTIIDLNNFCVIESNIGNNTKQRKYKYKKENIEFECFMSYTFYCPYSYENHYRKVSTEYKSVSLSELICSTTVIKQWPSTINYNVKFVYTYYYQFFTKHNNYRILITIDNPLNIHSFCQNMQFDAIIDMLDTVDSHIQCEIIKYVLWDMYKYYIALVCTLFKMEYDEEERNDECILSDQFISDLGFIGCELPESFKDFYKMCYACYPQLSY